MAKSGEHANQPLDRQTGWQMQNAVADVVCAQFGMRPLTEAEVAAAESGDVVINDAGLQRFSSWQEFKNPYNQNNFWQVFAGTPSDFVYVVFRRTLSFQRLEILNPNLVDELTSIKRGQFDVMDDTYEQKLYVAYSSLVDFTDINDPEISRIDDPEQRARFWQG